MDEPFPHPSDDMGNDVHALHDDTSAFADPFGHHAHLGLFGPHAHSSADPHPGLHIFGVDLQPLLDTTLLPHNSNWFDSIFHFPVPHHAPSTQTEHHDDSLLGIIGHPEEDATWWHQQQHDDTCAVVSQQFILDSLTHGQFHISEDQLQQEALDHGWYTPGGGTPLLHVGDLLSYHGFEVQKEHGATFQDMAHQLQQDHKVIAGVHAEDIWNAAHGGFDAPLTDYPGIPGHHANHAVEVIGINDDDPAHPVVILNDPGTPDGQALNVDADVFMNAWSASNNFMVHTTGSTSPQNHASAFSGLVSANQFS